MLNSLLTLIAMLDSKFEPTLDEDTIAIHKLNTGELTMDDPSVKQAMEYNPQLFLGLSTTEIEND